MSEPINIFSSNNIDERHVLFWDYDHFDDPEKLKERLQFIADMDKLDLFVLRTKKGIHLIDFYLRPYSIVNDIQKRLRRYLPSDYPLISEVCQEDIDQSQEFLGCTLRVSGKQGAAKPKYLYRITALNFSTSNYQEFSQGHVDMYKLMLEIPIVITGIEVPTKINLTSYLKDEKQK